MALVVATGAFSQLNYGVKLGGNIANISGVDTHLGVLDHDYGDASKITTTQAMKLGANVGIWAEHKLMPLLGVQMEVNFSMQGVNANSAWSTNTLLGSASANTDYTWSTNYITMPILAKAHFANLAAYVGPQIGFALGMTQKESSTNSLTPDKVEVSESALENYNSVDFSLVMGAQYKLTPNVGIDARYNLGLSNLFPAVTSEDGEVLSEAWGKQSVIQVGVFYEF